MPATAIKPIPAKILLFVAVILFLFSKEDTKRIPLIVYTRSFPSG
jgi:hypothetical protein